MASQANDVIKQLFQRFFRDELPGLSAEERAAFEGQFETRFADLLRKTSSGAPPNFGDLIGFNPGPIKGFDELGYPLLENDFDDSVIPSQLHASAELYFIYQMERMKLFQVVDVLRRLFQLGQLRIQRGPGARGLYILEKWQPIRYARRDRMIAYRRAFNYGAVPPPAGAVVNRNFHFQFVAFMSAMSQYFRDYTIGQVIRGSGTIDDRPFASLATIQRVGTDLRFQLDRASYGNILALTQEVGQYVQQILELLDAPDIKKSFDANTKWDVIETVSNRHLGGAAELSQRTKMAEAGRRVLQYIADNEFRTDIDVEVVPCRRQGRRQSGRGLDRRLPAHAGRPQVPGRHRPDALDPGPQPAAGARVGRGLMPAGDRGTGHGHATAAVGQGQRPRVGVVIDATFALSPLGLLHHPAAGARGGGVVAARAARRARQRRALPALARAAGFVLAARGDPRARRSSRWRRHWRRGSARGTTDGWPRRSTGSATLSTRACCRSATTRCCSRASRPAARHWKPGARIARSTRRRRSTCAPATRSPSRPVLQPEPVVILTMGGPRARARRSAAGWPAPASRRTRWRRRSPPRCCATWVLARRCCR